VSGSERLGGVAATILLVCCVAWGLNQVAIKISLAGVSPLLGAGLRSFIAAVLVWAWCRLRGEPLLTRDGTWGYGLFIGLLFAAEFVFIYGGLAFTTASRSVIFLYSAPFIVAFVGLCLAFVDGLALPSRRELLGDGLELIGGLLWAATTIIVKARRDRRLTPQRTLFYQLTVSAVALTGLSALIGERGVTAVTGPVAAAIAYQSVIVAFVSYLIWFWLLQRYPASGLAAFSFWTPIFGVLAGWLVLGERLTGNLGAAAVLVAVGIYLVNRRA
jgi:drug/metabolite transporter (DMT)-like permease